MGQEPRDRRRAALVVLVPTSAVLVVVLTALLASPLPLAVRGALSAGSLVLAGLVAAVACADRARALGPGRGRPWALMSAAGVVAATGNVLLVALGPDGTGLLVSNAAVALALLLSMAALVSFSGFVRQGLGLARTVLDGLVVGGAIFVVVTSVVFPEVLVDADAGLVDQVTAVAFPVMDTLLVALAVLLVLRAPSTRRLLLVGLGFVLYCLSDLSYALQEASGGWEFGGPGDVGWTAGYLLIAVAALTTLTPRPPRERQALWLRSEVVGTAVVLGLTVGAVTVQALSVSQGGLALPEVVLTVLVVCAAGTRQVLLTVDHVSLRRQLEDRVDDRTADLSSMVHQNDALLASVGEGIYGLDTEGRVVFANPVAARLLGCTPEQLRGVVAHEVFHVPEDPDDPHPWSGCLARRAMTSHTAATIEEIYRRFDGSTVPVESTVAPLMAGTGVRGAVVVFREISERREVELMKNEFLSVVSHELRTPLTAILGSLELIGSGDLGPLPPQVDRMVGVASRSSERLARLINDLLDVERIESGRQAMHRTVVGAEGLVVAAAQQVAGMALGRSVRVVVGATGGRVEVDEDQLLQTLVNLLSNAVKFSPVGGEVQICAQQVGSHVRFEVLDHGRGVPADKLEVIFDRFQQVDSSDARALGGTGLGLAISRGIVTRHGGTIWAESEPGVATRFVVRLPAALPAGSDTREQTVVLMATSREDEADADGVDEVLTRHGHRVVRVDDGEALHAAVERDRPTLVVIDLGRATAPPAVLLELGRGPAGDSRDAVPVVTISAHWPGLAPAAAAASDGWLVKPVGEEELVAMVARHAAPPAPVTSDPSPAASPAQSPAASPAADQETAGASR